MIPQEIFDKVSVHLLTQGKRALGDDGQRCKYRAPDGSKCAVGILIPDDAYDPVMEGHPSSALCMVAALPPFFTTEGDLLSDLQVLHDCVKPDMWPEYLHRMARHKGLSTTAMDEYLKTTKSPAPEVAA